MHRWVLTQALTGTALAARSWEHVRLNYDVGTMDYLKGSVRGRTLRLGKTTPLFDGARGVTGFAAMERDLRPGLGLRLTPPWNSPLQLGTAKSMAEFDLPGTGQGTEFQWW